MYNRCHHHEFANDEAKQDEEKGEYFENMGNISEMLILHEKS